VKVDPERGSLIQDGVQKSLLQTLVPNVTTLVISGDTGNGFRGMPMAWFHGTLFKK
jgi:hypothetical protein